MSGHTKWSELRDELGSKPAAEEARHELGTPAAYSVSSLPGNRLGAFTRADLDEIERKLNGGPRKTLGWLKPSEKPLDWLRRPLERAPIPVAKLDKATGLGRATS